MALLKRNLSTSLTKLRCTAAVFLCMAPVAWLHAQRTPIEIEHGTFAVHMLLRTIGTEEYTITDFGDHEQLRAVTNTWDRGTKRTVTTTLDFLPNLTPTRFEQHAATPATANAAARETVSLTEMAGTHATVDEAGERRSFTRPFVSFPGSTIMPASVQMLLMRYWNAKRHPISVSQLRADAHAPPFQIVPVGHDVFTANHEIVRLTRYTVANLVFGREVLWMNADNRVAAIMTFAGGLPQEYILDEYKPAFDPLIQSGVRQEMLDLAALSRSVRPTATGSFAIVGARLIDATGAAPVDNSVVVVRDGRIAAAGPAASIKLSPKLRVIHAEGKTLLPGLWEMHVHYSGVEFGPALLSAGITTARDCGGEFQFLTTVRNAIETQQQLGPRLLLAGLIDGSGPDAQHSLAFGAFTADTPEEGSFTVDMYADAHFDQIKVYTQIQPRVLRAIAIEAHRRGLTVTGHVPAAVDAFEAVADGMDQINHLQFVTRSMVPAGSNAPFALNDLASARAKELIALLAARHIVVDPTLGWGEMANHPDTTPTDSFEPGIDAAPFPLAFRYRNIGTAGMDEAKFHERMHANLATVDALFQAGVPIVAGSDTNLPGYGLDRELELYVQAGMSPMQAIQAATIVPARAMKRDADSGTIEAGKRADLVLIDGDPLQSIGNLRRVSSVVTNGRLYSSKALGHSVGFNR